ncbi:MAG: NAD(P)/FAD-dependent oxidoreductase [Nitrososphaerota archaeon]|nr:NAD(P)/FAD-dependent oxidoreductase [Nitrososphaerota archaeon]
MNRFVRDVSIIGGSVAGLLAARELASRGIDVTVYEDHREIGIPEKCDGLVSSSGMSELGLLPPSNVVQNELTKCRFFSPSMKEVVIDARKQNVIVLDRSRFDKYLAETAAREGAKIELGRRVSSFSQTKEMTSLKIGTEEISSKLLLNCSGCESFIRAGGKTLQGAQYLVYGSWFDKSTVEVYVNPNDAPGFFEWVIPISSDIAKIGVAGTRINTFEVMDAFVKERKAIAFRKTAAAVIASGAIKSFVDGRIARAGDAAGQPKPTSGGGIYTGGYGGMMAGRAASEAIKTDDMTKLRQYESIWREKFEDEFRMQLLARNAFAKLNAKQLDQLMEMIASSDIPEKISEEGDFDRHSISIIKAFGLANLFSVLGLVVSNEIKSLLRQ